MSAALKILIVGGYGTFGGHIVQLLEGEPSLTLIVAGRSLGKAQAFCRSRPNARARLVPAVFDRAGALEAQIAPHRPDMLVDASGPFQAYGEARYRVLEACLASRVNYLDLADGSEFVAGVKAFDSAARAAGVFALSGVSSFPVLTAAVARRLAPGFSQIDEIHGGIAPSPFAGVGENVIRAIASYAGQPTALRRDGAPATGHPLTETRRYTIAPPGRLPLENTLFSLVDVPDLRALAELWPEARTIWMGAGPVPEILHRLLIALSWAVRWRLVPTLSPLAPLMFWATNHLRWGEHRGGMFVEVNGRDAAGAPATRSWHLIAEGDDGPLIPSMAVEAIVRRTLLGRPPPPGARAATGDLELEDYEALFAGRTIYTGVRSEPRGGPYQRVLGPAFDHLPAEIRDLHSAASAEGVASVERGTNWLARAIGRIFGFPPATTETPVRVDFAGGDGPETWTRTFGTTRFQSELFAGRGRSDRLLVERFGPLAFAMALVVEGPRLRLVLRRWSAFGVPLPLWLAPRSEAVESVEDGRYRFDVEIGRPWLGRIVRYRGWLKPGAAGGEVSGT